MSTIMEYFTLHDHIKHIKLILELLLSNWAIEQKKKLQIYQKSINSQSLLNQLKYIQKSFFMKSYF